MRRAACCCRYEAIYKDYEHQAEEQAQEVNRLRARLRVLFMERPVFGVISISM